MRSLALNQFEGMHPDKTFDVAIIRYRPVLVTDFMHGRLDRQPAVHLTGLSGPSRNEPFECHVLVEKLSQNREGYGCYNVNEEEYQQLWQWHVSAAIDPFADSLPAVRVDKNTFHLADGPSAFERENFIRTGHWTDRDYWFNAGIPQERSRAVLEMIRGVTAAESTRPLIEATPVITPEIPTQRPRRRITRLSTLNP